MMIEFDSWPEFCQAAVHPHLEHADQIHFERFEEARMTNCHVRSSEAGPHGNEDQVRRADTQGGSLELACLCRVAISANALH